jgi:CRP/FNR family transcriptional regulator
MESIHNLIGQVQIFHPLDEQQKIQLARLSTRKRFEKGEFIAHYEEIWPQIFVVESGVISVLKLSSEGRNLGALRLGSGDFFISPSFFDNGPLPASLEVKEVCSIYVWHQSQVLSILKGNSEVLWGICLLLVQRMRQASEFVEELAFQPVTGRLARLLLDQFKESDDPQVARQFTLDEMSTMIGTTPVMVCKMLSRFAASDLIKVSRTEFKMLNRSELERMAGRK